MNLKTNQLNQLNTINKVITLRAYPNQEVRDAWAQLSGNERFVWNYCIRFMKLYHALFPNAKVPSRFDLNKQLRFLRHHYDFLKCNDSTGLQKTIERFSVAYKNVMDYYRDLKHGKYHRKTGFPHFKSRKRDLMGFGGKKSGNNIRVLDLHHIKVPKIGILRTSSTFDLAGWTIREYRLILKRTGHYYLYLFVEGKNQAIKQTGKMVGVDRNLKNLITLSNGKQFKSFKNHHIQELAHRATVYQRKMSRAYDRAKKIMAREKHEKRLEQHTLLDFSNYWYDRMMLNRYLTKLNRLKKEYLNAIANYLVSNYDVIVFEKLNISNMVKNHNLAKSILESGWGELYRMTLYKALWNSKLVVQVAPHYTTQICHTCGFQMGTNNTKKLTLNQREWNCPHCKHHQMRDQNAAINILNRFLNNPNKYLDSIYDQEVAPANRKKLNSCHLWSNIISNFKDSLLVE